MNQELFMSEEELKRYKVKKTFANIGLYTFLVLFALFIIIPFYWMIATALRGEDEMLQKTISFFPKGWTYVNHVNGQDETFVRFGNFAKAFTYAKERGYDFLRFYGNTIMIGAFTTFGTLVTTVFAAFAFARLNFKSKSFLFSAILATMMIPGEIYVITNYVTVSDMGLLKSTTGIYAALVLPFITSVFYMFFLRQTFMQIPNELYLAAKVDGTGDFKYLFKVMIPMSKATLTTILILSMMGTWNAYVWPSLVSDSAGKTLLVSNGLLTAFAATDATKSAINLQMAAATLITVPLLIVFFCLKKYIMSGVSRSGIKG